MARSRGYVRWFNSSKGWGFLIPVKENAKDFWTG